VMHIEDYAFYGCKFYSSDGMNILPQTALVLAGHTYSGSNSKDLVQDVLPYSISFISGEVVLSYEIGPEAIIVLPNFNITKDSDAQYDYTFSNWDDYIENMKASSDVTFTAVFNKEFRIYADVPSNVVLEELIKNNDEPVLKISVDSIKIIEDSIFEYLDEENKSLTINVMNENDVLYSWIFAGNYKPGAGIFNADISRVTPDVDIKDAMSYKNIENPLVLNFAANGELPMNAYVNYYVGDMYENGTELSLFFYNEGTKQLKDQSQTMIVTDGFVTFELTHCSSYVLAEVSHDMMLYLGIGVFAVMLMGIVAAVSIRFGQRS